MKLLMISGDRALASGKKGAFFNTLEEFHKYWDRIDIITPKIPNSPPQTLDFFGNVFIHSSPWPLIFQPWWILKKGSQICREQKPDLMTVHEYPPFYNGIGARMLHNKVKVPYVLEIMHIPGYPKAASLKEKIYKRLMRLFIKYDSKKVKAIRIINKRETREFLVKSGVSERKLIFIPAFYIDLDIFRPMNPSSDGDKKYDLVFAARLEKNKGIFDLLKAVLNVKNKVPDAKLLIIGSGSLKNKLTDFVEKNNLKENVIFSGWLKGPADVAAALNSAKIFIIPSFNEGGPRVALEAMACGLPVITTKVGLMLDIVEDSQNGLFSGWGAQDIAEKIIYLLNNKELQSKFSEANLQLIKQFERKSAVKNYAEKLKSLI